jgi:NADH-quinone oxidoreductase subunit H
MTLGSPFDIAGILGALITVAALLIWVERRLLAIWQDRLGPNRVGPLGLFQVVADMLKILSKEDWIPPFADKPVFVLAPVVIMGCMLAAFAVIPIAPDIGIIDFDFDLLYVLAVLALSVYSVVLAGYASNSKYSLIGSLRATAQAISYEVFLAMSALGVVMLAGTFDLRAIVEAQRDGWFVVPQFLGFILFFIGVLAETHRTPFDLPEAENELVAGYHTEYSGMKFGMFFVGEYIGVTLGAALTVTLFFGGWLGPVLPPLAWFIIKTTFFILLFILVRGSLPRPRYDQLMSFGWLVMLPLAFLNLLVTGAVILWR